MKIEDIRNNHLVDVIRYILDTTEDIIAPKDIDHLFSELMLATLIAPSCGAGLIRGTSKNSDKINLPLFTSIDEFNIDFEESNIFPVPFELPFYLDFLDDDEMEGIVINPGIDNFFISNDWILEIYERYPDFTSYWNLKSDFTIEELKELYNKDTSDIDSFLDDYMGFGLGVLVKELSKSVVYTYTASKEDLSKYIDDGFIKTSDVEGNGIFTVKEDNLEGCYIFTSPKYFKPTQEHHEKQGWNLFALPTTLELMAKYIIELDLDALVINPAHQNIVIYRNDLLKYLNLIIDECGKNIEYIFDDYSFALKYSEILNISESSNEVSEGYDVKVRLDDFRPLTWRDLIIPSNMTFDELDNVLKTLWGFNASHLSAFGVKQGNIQIMNGDIGDLSLYDYDSKSTYLNEFFEDYNKIDYVYDFGDGWSFTIEIKKKIYYDKDYVTIKRYKGEYNPIEDGGGVYGLAKTVYFAENPSESDDSIYADNVDILEKFDMDYTQELLKDKNYVVNPFL